MQRTRAKAREAAAAAERKKLLQAIEAEGMNATFVLQRKQRTDQISRDKESVALNFCSINNFTVTSLRALLIDFHFEISF